MAGDPIPNPNFNNVVSGARCRFSIDGVVVGYATGVTVREMITLDPVKVLDNIHVSEFVPTDYDVSMTADLVRIVDSSIKQKGWFPQQGAKSSVHLTNMISQGDLSAKIEDTQFRANPGDPATPKIIMQVTGVKFSERNLNVLSRGVVGTNVSMVAKKAHDESDLMP